MTSRDFCFWLQGWFELNKTVDHREGATPETMKMIEEHLQLVFKHDVQFKPIPPASTSGTVTVGGSGMTFKGIADLAKGFDAVTC